MKRILIDYPDIISFKTNKEFKNNDERTNWLVSAMTRKKIHSPNHAYTDYVVEFVENIDENTEYWGIGS